MSVVSHTCLSKRKHTISAVAVGWVFLLFHNDAAGSAGHSWVSHTKSDFQSKAARLVHERNDIPLEDPLGSTPCIKSWVSEITKGVKDTQEAVRKVYEILCEVSGSAEPVAFTAREAFEAMVKGRKLDCFSGSCLFISACRSLGVDAFLVDVKRDTYGYLMGNDLAGYHVCAGILIGKDFRLIDVTYKLFPAKHLDYCRLDDSEALAMSLVGRAEDTFKRSGDVVKAIALAQTAAKIKPNCFYAHSSLGGLYHIAGRIDSAIEEWKAAVQLRPDDVQALVGLGSAYYARGDFRNAIEQAHVALSKSTRSKDLLFRANYLLGAGHYNLGELLVAIHYFQKAKAICSEDSDVKEALRTAIKYYISLLVRSLGTLWL